MSIGHDSLTIRDRDWAAYEWSTEITFFDYFFSFHYLQDFSLLFKTFDEEDWKNTFSLV